MSRTEYATPIGLDISSPSPPDARLERAMRPKFRDLSPDLTRTIDALIEIWLQDTPLGRNVASTASSTPAAVRHVKEMVDAGLMQITVGQERRGRIPLKIVPTPAGVAAGRAARGGRR